MSAELKYVTLNHYETDAGIDVPKVRLSYQVFGEDVGQKPVILVHHALTGNSNVADPENGWWKEIVGPEKVLDTNRFSVIAFNVFGNGYDGTVLDHPELFSIGDIAELQYRALIELGIQKLHTAIGGSVGGGIAWELAIRHPEFVYQIIPIASAWKSSAWIKGQCHVQKKLVELNGISEAREMAMLLYRNPDSFDTKFNAGLPSKHPKSVENWLTYHGTTLQKRFQINAYSTMNYLLSDINIGRGFDSWEKAVDRLQAKVIQVGIDSDILFHPSININTQQKLNELGKSNDLHWIHSPHGHDAFLIEHEQLTNILTPYFSN